jgi:hypothetical protein
LNLVLVACAKLGEGETNENIFKGKRERGMTE